MTTRTRNRTAPPRAALIAAGLVLTLTLMLAGALRTVAQTAAPGTVPAQVASPVAAASPAPTGPLDARLGGTRGSFERAFGGPILAVPTILYPFAYGYGVKGFGSIEVFYDQDQALAIQLASPRAAAKRGYAPDPADWSLAKAQGLAHQFLPRDVRTDPAQRTPQGNMLTPCYSQSLAKAVHPTTYAVYRLRGQPGDCEYTFYLSNTGQVFAIQIGLGDAARALAPLELPASLATPPAVPAGTPVTQALANLSPAEQTYVNSVKSQVAEIRTTIVTFDQLINNPKTGDATWTANLDKVLSTWQSLYTNARTVTPPARFQSFNAQYVQMLSLFASAGDDIKSGISSNDATRINSAGAKLQQALTLLNSLDSELNKALS